MAEKRVTGIGGIFFKAKDPKGLKEWYREHLGIEPSDESGTTMFEWIEADGGGRRGVTVWSPFPQETRYFEPSRASFMINYRVENLERVVDQLRREGVEVDPRVEDSEYGRFAWAMDPEGNRIELWEPPQK